MFIGREAELDFLNDKYEEEGGQLVVLYGRRRVGKTETLREFCKGKPHVFFSCTQTTDRVQLQKFSRQMMNENIPAGNYITEFDDWEKAIRAILDLRNILTKGCILYSEVDFLLHQELRETSVYNSVIEVVALGNTSLNSISQKSLMEDTSKTSVYLKNLIELGIVQREFSVDAKVKERANGNRGIYRPTDNFFRFWYAFVFANFSQLEDGDVDGVYEYIVEPALHEFAAFTFEDICREFVRKTVLTKK